MSDKKFTPWFPGDVKPARPGVYQQLSAFNKTLGYQRWNGSHWSSWFFNAEDAARSTDMAAHSFQNDPWRGLTKESK